jgi:hypothetical protein
MKDAQVPTLDDMPPIKKVRKTKKKHHTTNNVPVEVSIRRQLSAELGDDEPSKDEKFSLLQKYGVTAPRIDRLVTKPNWMGVAEWKRKQNDWFKATKGLVNPTQRPRSNFRPTHPSSTPKVTLDKYGKPLTRPVQPWKGTPNSTPTHRRPDTRVSPRNSGQTQTAIRPN